MIEDTISPRRARSFYDFLGPRYDWTAFYESRAKSRALQALNLRPGMRLLNVGVGTGRDHRQLLEGLLPGGIAVGLDFSPVMARLAYDRTGQPMVEADGRRLPFVSGCFDRLISTYVLDLLPAADIPAVLEGFRRVLKPGGQAVLLSLTEGADPLSRGLVAAWKLAYAISPLVCGGCRPLQLTALVTAAGLNLVAREVIVQWGVPSELIVARRDE